MCWSEVACTKRICGTDGQEAVSWCMWAYERPSRFTGDVKGWDWLLAPYFYSWVALYANSTVDRLDAGFKNSTVRRTGA